MARPVKAVAAALALALGVLVALPARGAEDKELKKARSELKKSEKLLVSSDAFEGENADALSKALDAVSKVRAAENAEAVEFLLLYAKATPHQPVFEKIRDEVGSFTHDDAVKALVHVLAKKDKKAGSWEARALAAECAAKIANPKIVDGLLAALNEDEPNVLNPAIISSGKHEDKRLIPALVALLKKVEKYGGWEYHHVRQALVELTGQDFFTHEKWKQWWDSNKDSFEFGKKGDAKEAKTQERANEKKPTFFETEVKSNRFCFVIDVSGSMKMCDVLDAPDDPAAVQKAQEHDPTDEYVKANSRIERAKTELKKAIANLDPTARFNMLSFSDRFQSWSPDIVPATDANKKAATAWVENLKADGGTYTDDALSRAFQMVDIDTIYFLSDGAPEKPGKGKMSAEENQRELMKVCYGLIEKERRFRKITINTFGLCGLGIWFKKWGARPQSLSLDPKSVEPLRDFMKKVAEMTDGAFKQL